MKPPALMVDPILQPDGYSEDAATEAAAMAQDYQASPETANEQDYPDVFLILSESFYDFDLVTDLQADQEIMQVTKNLPNSIYGHTISPHVGGRHQLQRVRDAFLQLADADALHHTVQLVEPAQGKQPGQQPERSGVCHAGAHPYTNSNYRRDSAWLTLGFDETHFQDDFPSQGNPMAAAPTRPTAPPTATWKVCMKQCRRTSHGLCSWFPSRATAITI